MMLFLEACAKQEGFYKTGTRPNRLNNPGDLEYRGWEVLYGGTNFVDKRFSHFPTAHDGFKAMQHLFTFSIYFGKKLSEVFSIYAPQVENNTNIYLENVCRDTGFTPDTILTMELLTLPE